MKLLIKNGTVYQHGSLIKCNIGVADEKISYIGMEEPEAESVIDARGKYVLPGSIDTHVHIRAPGCDVREIFLTGTMAAAAGGTTLIVEQPICNSTPYNVENLEYRNSFASKEAVVDYTFYGAAGSEYPDKIEEIKNSGIVAYKTFLQKPPKGRENEFTNLYMENDKVLFEGMKNVAATGRALMFHAENHEVIGAIEDELRSKGMQTGIAHVMSRPSFTEAECVGKIIQFARITGTKLIFAHISTVQAMELIRQAKIDGMEIYCETCVHYLTLTEEALDRFGPFAKCNPPVRDLKNQEGLWSYVNDHYTVDAIGSDHSPFLYEEKNQWKDDIFKAPAGLIGIDLRVPLLLDAVFRGKSSLTDMVELLSVKPAKMLGLYPRKGDLITGCDADIIIVDPARNTIVDNKKSYSRTAGSQVVYQGAELRSVIDYTIVRGRVVSDNGKVDAEDAGCGQWIKPEFI